MKGKLKTLVEMAVELSIIYIKEKNNMNKEERQIILNILKLADRG